MAYRADADVAHVNAGADAFELPGSFKEFRELGGLQPGGVLDKQPRAIRHFFEAEGQLANGENIIAASHFAAIVCDHSPKPPSKSRSEIQDELAASFLKHVEVAIEMDADQSFRTRQRSEGPEPLELVRRSRVEFGA